MSVRPSSTLERDLDRMLIVPKAPAAAERSIVHLFSEFHQFAQRIREECGEDVVVALAYDGSDLTVQTAFFQIEGMGHKKPLQVRLPGFDPENPSIDVGVAGAALIDGVVRDLNFERDQIRKANGDADRLAEQLALSGSTGSTPPDAKTLGRL